MTRRGRSPVTTAVTVALLALALTLFSAPPSGAQSAAFLGPYAAALEALEGGEWQRARQLLLEAIEANPESGRYRGAGTRFVSYTPHYFLGLALYRLGDCRAALQAWEAVDPETLESLASEEFRSWNELRPVCREQLAVAERADDLRREIRRAEEARDRARQVLEGSRLAGRRESDALQELRAEDARAAGSLESARQALQAGGAESDPRRLRSAADEAVTARNTWERVRAEAERQAALAESSETAESNPPDDAGETGEEAPEQVPEAPVTRLDDRPSDRPEPPPVSTREDGTEVEADAEGSVTGETPSPEPSGEADSPESEDPSDLPDDTIPAAGERWRAPGPLREAARAYFELGAYREAVDILADERFADSRATSRQLLLLAAAYHALSTIEADRRAEHLEQARRYAADYAATGDASMLDSSFFSPRFIRFCRSVRE